MRQTEIMVLPATVDRRARLRVSGELDIASIAGLQAHIDAVLTRHPAPLEVDLSAVTFFSCAAAQALRRAHLRAPGSLTVTGATPPVRRLLEIMQLQPLLIAEVTPAAAQETP